LYRRFARYDIFTCARKLTASQQVAVSAAQNEKKTEKKQGKELKQKRI